LSAKDVVGAAFQQGRRGSELCSVRIPMIGIDPGLVDTPNAFAKGVIMPRTRVPYSPEFRRQMVDLARAGRDPDDLAREFEPTAQSIRNWIAQADKREGGRAEALPGLSAAEQDELSRLRRENRQLRVERDILSKAAAWFARETGAVPSGSSGS
jgi:transposase